MKNSQTSSAFIGCLCTSARETFTWGLCSCDQSVDEFHLEKSIWSHLIEEIFADRINHAVSLKVLTVNHLYKFGQKLLYFIVLSVKFLYPWICVISKTENLVIFPNMLVSHSKEISLGHAGLHRGTAPTSSLDLWVMQSYYTPGIAGYEENKPVILDLYKHMFACEYFAKAKYKIVQSHLSRQEKRTCWNAVSELMGIAFKIIHIYI